MKNILTILFLLSAPVLWAQVIEPVPIQSDELSDHKDTAVVYDYAEQMPEFPGGTDSLNAYIARNLVYPRIAVEENIEGKVYVRFVVNEDGRISDVQVVKKLHPTTDKAAVDLVKGMPKWKSGKHKGNRVKVRYTLPIKFSLEDDMEVSTNVPPGEMLDEVGTEPLPIEDPPVSGETYLFAEQMPEFPGGEGKLMEYINSNTVYPAEAKEKGIMGKVVVSFIVLEDGSISDVKVQRSVHPLLDQAALDVIKGMPKWTPGKQNGKVVKVRFVVPVKFTIN